MRAFAIPACFAVLSAVGLVSALLGDGAWDALSWISLGVPLAATAFVLQRFFLNQHASHPAPGQVARQPSELLPGEGNDSSPEKNN